MKNQYAGDIGDYTKLGILRKLETAGFSIGLNWYLTPDEPEHSKSFNDGKHTEFWDWECKMPDSELHNVLKEFKKQKRCVAKLEQANLFKNALFWDQILESKNREPWHFEALKYLGSQDIIFLDPDNGLEVKSTKPKSKNGNKYTTYQEVADYYKKGSSVIVYNHRDRKSHDEYIKRFTRFRELPETADAKMFYLRASRCSVRDYLFIIQEKDFVKVCKTIDEFLITEWKNYLMKHNL